MATIKSYTSLEQSKNLEDEATKYAQDKYMPVLTAAFAAMFVVMAESRAMYHHGEMINYMLTQQLDSLKLVKGY